jgi:LacI family transcriptional regulator
MAGKDHEGARREREDIPPTKRNANRRNAQGVRAPTIREVAEAANVSISTVSLALNTPERVAEKTLARVMGAVEELDFVPKAEAAVRARKGTRRIGVVAPFTSYPSFMERLRGVMAAAAEAGYEVVVYDDDSLALRNHLVDSLPLSRRLDGVILMSMPVSDRFAGRLLKDGLKAVFVEFPRPEFSSVLVDDEAGGRMAAEYLAGKGHERCAYLGESFVAEGTDRSIVAMAQGERRLAGFEAGLAAAGLSLPKEMVARAVHGAEHAREAAHSLLGLSPRPTAIFAHGDVMAAGALKAARERGLSSPADVAVVGFDDLDLAEHLGLTTVRQPLYESGRVAVRLLKEQLSDGGEIVPQRVNLPLSLVERETA